MNTYLQALIDGYKGYAGYLWNEITLNYTYKPLWQNYFYGLILVSLFFWALEWIRPWRIEQPKFRKDFWLDFFYMFFNFFLFNLIAYQGWSNVFVTLFNQFLESVLGITNLVAIQVQSLPVWGHLLLVFVVNDFCQWWVHRLLHRSPRLWEFHKLHHSVEQMGFAAHLRYHWMENVVYKSLTYIPLAMLGVGLNDFFWVHIFALAWGHFNHSNIYVPLGPLKYLFNSPQMHIWHHAQHIPNPYGVNFGITLSVWDYLFGTAHIPHDGRDIPLGFDNLSAYPKTFWKQLTSGFGKTS
jgi:sterol desaturase/sphingolipid hydroxylase (fatty acid hydroxylase superfamily)